MRKTIYTLLVCSVLIISCSKAGEILDDSKQTNASSTRSGNTASDPYRLEAMQLAFDEISKASGIEHINLKPTDKYVKFIPDSVDCQKLSDMGIIIYPFRLDGQDTIESADGKRDCDRVFNTYRSHIIIQPMLHSAFYFINLLVAVSGNMTQGLKPFASSKSILA